MSRHAPYAAVFDFSMAALETAGPVAEIKGDPAPMKVPLMALTEPDISKTKRRILVLLRRRADGLQHT